MKSYSLNTGCVNNRIPAPLDQCCPEACQISKYQSNTFDILRDIIDETSYGVLIRDPGGRLNKKDGLTRYGDSHVKDKTS